MLPRPARLEGEMLSPDLICCCVMEREIKGSVIVLDVDSASQTQWVLPLKRIWGYCLYLRLNFLRRINIETFFVQKFSNNYPLINFFFYQEKMLTKSDCKEDSSGIQILW